MNRRSILKGLLALPFAPLLAKAAQPTGHRVTCRTALPKLSMMPGDPVYTAQYKNMMRVLNPPMTLRDVAKRCDEKMLDLKPVLERLNKQSWNTNWRVVSKYILPEIK